MPEIIPLQDLDRRFPKPKQRSDVLLTYPLSDLSQEEIFSFLTNPHSELWQHKLRWKNYMRLLIAGDWVFKTSEWHCSEDLQSLEIRIANWKELSQTLKIWHPKKYWFILRQEDGYWACNATPRLVTLPDVGSSIPKTSLLDQIKLIIRWSQLNLWVWLKYRLVLDCKIDNFAVSQGNKHLYYVDDEVYRYESWRDFFLIRKKLLY
jgi:hypothetical protein